MPARSNPCSGKKAVEAQENVTRLQMLHRYNGFRACNIVTILTAYVARSASNVGLGLRQADDFLAVLPLAAFLQKLDALEAFQDIALGCNGASAF